MTTVLYARVSTAEQTIEHQLEQAIAAGYTIDSVVSDHGVSGISTNLKDRPEGKRLFDMLRKGDTLVVRWVDRLGRNYVDVSGTIREFMQRGVVVRTVINNLVFDGATTDPMQQASRDAMIGFMAAMAQAQAEANKQAQKAGIEYAKAKPETRAYRGRKPTYTRVQYQNVQDMIALGFGTSAIAKATSLTRQTVIRLRDDPAAAEAVLKTWGL